MRPSTKSFLGLIVVVCAIGVVRIVALQDAESVSERALAEPLGYRVTEGAAPGYIDDQACGVCHADLHDSYQQVGMARSFMRPHPANFIEDFEAEPYLHERSQNYYRMTRRGDRLVFERYQLDDDGEPVHRFEREVDWILGSGNKTRSYLYQTDAGELYQFPIGWYSEIGQWRMAPGFDHQQPGVQRQVRRECVFCHNAYPEVPAGSDAHWEPHFFPKELPEGIGCQRCHGPGAGHIRTVLDGGSRDEIRKAIVNPARLSAERRDSVCYQCHMQPAVALFGVRRLDRGDYSFRPGEPLSDYMLHVDIEESNRSRGDRFEINHHAYRLRQSACFQQSEGNLTCITCHDPHRNVPPKERVEHYATVCMSCHEPHEPVEELSGATHPDDCAACHMPQRRAQDVVHVVMTDHRIQKYSGGAKLLEPLEETEPVIEGLDFLFPEDASSGAEGDVYRLITILRARATADLVDRLERILFRSPPEDPRVYVDLARAQILLQRNEAAEKTLRALPESIENHPMPRQWLGIAQMGQGKLEEAEESFRHAVELNPAIAEIHFNLGLLLLRMERHEEATESLQTAAALRPNFAAAWFYLGEVHARLGNADEAIAHYRRVLEIDPAHRRAAEAEAVMSDEDE